MNQDNQDFDPQQILYEHQQFFEANKNSFSPAPKRFLTPNQSDEKLTYKPGSVDQRDPKSLLASGQNAQEQIDNYQQQHQQSMGQSPDGKSKELLIMTIEIGDGNRDTLRVFEDDDPYELAQRFCQIHQLNPQIVEPLAHNIYANIEKVLEERAQGTTETTRVQENEPQDQGQASNNQSIIGQDYRQMMQQNDGFKDMGVRTGEFRSIKDDQGQHDSGNYQQHQQFGGMQEYRADKRQKNKEQHQQQQQIYNYVDEEEESAQQNEWDASPIAPLKASKSNKEFGIRASYEKSKKSRNPPQQQEGDYTDYNTQTEDHNRKWTNKSTEASNRMSHVEYPSDRRQQQLGNVYPENFQNEEEYLEHLIMSQYGNNSYERGASFMKNHYNNGKK